MTNKKLKLAAMSVALTACVAAQPMAAHAVEGPDAAEDDNAAQQTAPAKDAAAETDTAEAQSEEAAEPQEDFEAPVNDEAPEDKQLPAFGPGYEDSSNVEIDYGETNPDPDKDNTTVTEGPVIDKSQKDDITGEPGKEIGEATKTEAETSTSTTPDVTPSTDPDDVLGRTEDGGTLVKGTETTITEGKGEAESTTKTDPEEKEVGSLENELGKDYRDKLNWDISDKTGEDGKKTTIGDYEVDTVTDSEDGDSKNVTLKKTEKTDGRLSAEEIKKLLDANDLETKEETDEKGNVKTTYTLKKVEPITDADGKVIGTRTTYYEVTDDKVTTITETTLTVTVAKGTETGKVDKTTEIKLPDITAKNNDETKTDVIKISSDKLDEMLKDGTPNGSKITYTEEIKNTDGTTTTRDYTITVDDSKTEGLENEDIAKLLGDGFTGDESGVYYKGEKLTTDQLTAVRRTLSYDVTVNETTRKPGQVAEGDDLSGSLADAEAKAKLEALRNALIAAAKKAGIELSKDELDSVTLDGDHLTVNRTDDTSDTTYNYTFNYKGEDITTVSNSTKTGETTINGKDAENVEETVVSGTAYVTGGSKSWTGTETVDSNISSILGGNYTKLPEGVTADKDTTVDKDDKGRITRFVSGGVVYEFTYNDNVELTDELLKKLEERAAKEGWTFDKDTIASNLTSVTWKKTTPASSTTEDAGPSFLGKVENNDWKAEDSNGKYKLTYTKKDGTKETIDGLVRSEDGKTYTKTAADGTIYTFTVSSEEIKDDEIKALLKEKYGDTITIKSFNNGQAVFTKDGKEYTVDYSLTKETLTLKTESSKVFTDDNEYLKWVRDQITEAEANGEEIKLGNKEVNSSMSDAVLKEIVEKAVNYNKLTKEQISALLKELQDKATKSGDCFTGKNNHTDLDIDAKLVDSENESLIYDAVVMNPTFTVSKSADDLLNEEITNQEITLQGKISYDSGSKRYEYQHEMGSNGSQVDGSQFYQVTGKVAYGQLYKERTDYRGQAGTFTSESEANSAARDYEKANNLPKGSVTVVPFYTSQNNQFSEKPAYWKIYEHTATLTAYGYMTQSSNTCKLKNEPGSRHGYDLLLSQLTLYKDKVYGQGEKVTTYSNTITRTKKNYNTSLNATKATYDENVEASTKEGNDLYGTYDVSFKQSYEWKKDSCNEAKGTGSGRFKSFTELLKKVFSGTGSASRNEVSGSYSYKTTDKDKLNISAISKVEQTTTVAHVDYNYTTVSEKDTIVVVPPETPVVPPEDPDVPPVQDETVVTPETPELPPVEDATPDQMIAPANPELPPVQDATALPQTGVNWLTALGMALSGMTLMIMGAFTSLKYKAKH